MSEVTRYGHISYLVEATPQILQLYPSMTVYVMASDFERITAERDALQQRLNAADQRIDELTSQREPVAFPGYPQVDPDRQQPFTEQFLEDHLGKVPDQLRDHTKMIAAKALDMDSKPPTCKPGLYAVRHIDNWDGQRDVVLTFAMLDADGKWTDKETGKPLLTYDGDKVLAAWPLDCPDAPGTQIIGVPRNWLEDWALELVEAAQDGGQMSNQVEHLLELHAKR